MKTLAAMLLMLLVALPTVAQAQAITDYNDEVRWKLASAQLVESLESPINTVRTQSLRNAIIYATFYRDKIDLGAAVSALRTVYEEDPRASHRKMALAALQAIGNNRASDYLARNVSEAESDEGRLVMASVLNEFYQSRTGTTAGATTGGSR